MAKHEAVFIPINCVSTHKTFYARYDYAYDNKWVLTYGLKSIPSDSSGGISTGNMSKIDMSNTRVGPQYKCPYCGNYDFVRCGRCHKLTCYSGSGKFVCDHCGNTGDVNGTIDSLEGDRRHSQ